MSINSDLKARLEQLAPVRVEPRRPLSSAAAETVLIRRTGPVQSLLPALHLLRAAGMTLRLAHLAIDDLAGQGWAICRVAKATDLASLAADLRAMNLDLARRHTETDASSGIIAVRQRHGLSQSEFADRLGFDLRTLQNWEQGENRPSAAALLLIRLFDRDPEAVVRAVYAPVL